jgi:hypothetical protein
MNSWERLGTPDLRLASNDEQNSERRVQRVDNWFGIWLIFKRTSIN